MKKRFSLAVSLLCLDLFSTLYLSAKQALSISLKVSVRETQHVRQSNLPILSICHSL